MNRSLILSAAGHEINYITFGGSAKYAGCHVIVFELIPTPIIIVCIFIIVLRSLI
jgi:hypothetical protein